MLSLSKMSAFFPIVISLLVLLESAQAINYSPQCDYRGYAPGKVNKVGRSSAVKPEKFESTVLQTGLDYFMQGSGVSAATLGIIDAMGDIMKTAPQITAAIGILSVGLGFAQKSSSPQDIVDKAYSSVQLLSDEVNVMMDQMQDYADAGDLNLEKTIMKNNYRELFDRWFGCRNEQTVASANDCQRRTVNDMTSARYHFQKFHEEFGKGYSPNFDYRASAAWWQWLKERCGKTMQCLSHQQVKQVEVGIIPFRDYASLHLLALQALVASYKAQPINTDKVACGEYKRYLRVLADKGDLYARYAEWAHQWTYIRQYEENDFYGVPGRSGGRSDSAFRGGFLGTRQCSGNKCTMQCSQMFKDNTCTTTGASSVYMSKEIFKKCERYVGEVKRQLEEFWKNKVLSSSNLWKQYSDKAKEQLKAVKCFPSPTVKPTVKPAQAKPGKDSFACRFSSSCR